MKIKFKEDKFYNGELKFKKDIVYEVSEELGWAQRWLNRGGVQVEENFLNEIPVEKTLVEAPIETESVEEKLAEVSEELEDLGNALQDTKELVQDIVAKTSSKKNNKKATSK